MIKSLPRRRNRRLLAEWLLLVAALLSFGGYVAYLQYQEYQQTDTQERARLASQVSVIEKNLVPQLRSASRAMTRIREDLPAWRAQQDRFKQANGQLDRLSDALPGIRTLLITDADGNITASNVSQILGASLSHRQWFQLAKRNNAAQTLYLIAPIRSLINTYTAALARSIVGPRGEFAGVIYASIHPDFAKTLLDSVLYTPDARVFMAHGDGIVFIVSPDREDLIGKSQATPGSLFSRHRDGGQAASVFTGIGALSGDARMVAFRTIQPSELAMDKPLVVSLSRDLHAVFASWRSQAWIHGVVFAALTLFAVLGLHLHQRRQRAFERHTQRHQEALQTTARHQNAIFDASPDTQLISTAQGIITQANQQAERLLGYTVDELVGRSIEDLVPARARLAHPKLRDEFASAPGSRRMRRGLAVKAVRKDGSECDVEVSLSRIDSGQGYLFVSVLRDLTERKQAAAKIEELAFFDQLTGLPNRTLLLDRLRQAMTVSGRSGKFAALLLIDLDHFKTLNDTLGHDVGDLLLKQVGKRLSMCVREGDTVARLGGDEFVVILTSLSVSEVDAGTGTKAVTRKILDALNETYQLDEVKHHTTASIGAALFLGQLSSVDDLMKQADLAMYRAKAAGRNAVRFFDPEMELAVLRRVALEKDLDEAIVAQQFLLHYQAQVTSEGCLTGAEALVRWQHPLRGMVPPGDFIPLAEETGLILPLGRWVLEAACMQLALWASQAELAHLTVAVNVSAHQFRQTDFVAQVLGVLEKTGANPRRLKLELTESLLVDNVGEVIDKMSALKARGVGFALDDFGTGYSSLSYLKRLPLDQLKIDQSFVRDVLLDPNDAAIAWTIVALASSLGLDVIAEGVETVAQRDFLAAHGCHAYQGYLFGRPLAPQSFEQWARESMQKSQPRRAGPGREGRRGHHVTFQSETLDAPESTRDAAGF